MSPLPNIDAELRHADWLKGRSWDLPTEPEAFRVFLERSGQTLAQFLAKPVARAMPTELRQALTLGNVRESDG